MPDWVRNNLTLRGSRDVLERIIAESFTEGEIDFEKIVPMPDGFDPDIDEAPYSIAVDLYCSEEGWRQYLHEHVREAGCVDRMAVIRYHEEQYAKNPRGGYASLKDIAASYVRNVELTGCGTCYDWHVENWGTKWNACWSTQVTPQLITEVRPGEHEMLVQFSTPWSAPLPVIEALRERYPSVDIRIVSVFENYEVLEY